MGTKKCIQDVLRVSESMDGLIDDEFLDAAMQCNDGCGYWWSVQNRTIIEVQRSEDGWQAGIKCRINVSFVITVELTGRLQLICLLIGHGF